MKNTLTKFDIVKIIGLRAEQLDNGAPSFLDIEKLGLTDSFSIATKEFENGKIPFIINKKISKNIIKKIPILHM